VCMAGSRPIAHLVTLRTFGTRLHGDARGSHHRIPLDRPVSRGMSGQDDEPRAIRPTNPDRSLTVAVLNPSAHAAGLITLGMSGQDDEPGAIRPTKLIN